MPGLLPTNWLDPLLWGTQTGGACGPAQGETLNTLGIDRLDMRVPPDQYHVGGLQISQCKNLLITMSAWYQGGSRLKCLTQSSPPFASNETGYWVDCSGNARYNYNGTAYYISTSVGANPAATTLQGAYNNGSAGQQVVTVDASRLGIVVRDASSSIGATLFGVQNNAGSSKYLDITPTAITATLPTTIQQTSIGTAQTVAGSIQNTTAATAGAQQYSPMLEFYGSGWKTTATAASQVVKWGVQNRPVQGTTSPTGELVFWNSINAGAYAESVKINSADRSYVAPHFVGYGPAPTVGTSAMASASISGTDSSGYVTFTTKPDSAPSAGTTVATVTFGTSFASSIQGVVICAGDAGTGPQHMYPGTLRGGSFDIISGTGSWLLSTTYSIYYVVIG